MTRHKSVHDSNLEETTDVRNLRMRTKESEGWDLVQRHDLQLKYTDARVENLELKTETIASEIRQIREGQIESRIAERQIIEKLNSAEKQRAEAAAKADSKNDSFKRNAIAFGSMVVAIVALSLKQCGHG